MFVKGFDDVFHQRMAHDVAFVELHDADVRNAAQNLHRAHQPAVAPAGQVDLRHVARDDEPRIAAHARQEHLDLRQGGVLRLVQNDEGVVQRAAAHVGQRGDLHGAVLEEFLELHGRNHVVQSVVKGLQVGIELLLHVAGQESQFFARLDGRAREDDAFDLLLLQCTDGQRNGRIGLSRAGGPHGEQQVVLVVEFDEPLLVDGPRTDDVAVVAVDDHVLVHRGVVLRDAARETLVDDLRRDVPVLEVIGHQRIHAPGEPLRLGLGAEDLERRAAGHDFQRGVQRFDLFEIDVLRPVEFAGIDALDCNFLSDSFRHRSE